MPHVIVKVYPGKTDEEKSRLAAQISAAVMNVFGSPEPAVSVSIEDVEKEVWADTVYKPDILDKPNELFKKPGYNPFK